MNDWKQKIKRKGLGDAPQTSSENLKSPELAPSDQRLSGRTKRIGLIVNPDFHKKLKLLAAEENVFIVEIIEKAVECWEKHRKK